MEVGPAASKLKQPGGKYRVQLLGGFALLCEESELSLPPEAQRLVAFLALHPGRLTRGFVAGNFWAERSEGRALANLRSTLCRLRPVAPQLVDADAQTIGLEAGTTSDVRDVEATANQLLGSAFGGNGDLDYRFFALELLPGWYDDEWVVVARERLRQLGLHALESFAERFTALNRHGAAIQVTLLAISLDTLRESPRRQLVRIHLAEGNVSEALRQYDEYARLLDRELHLRPTPAMRELLPRNAEP